MVGWLACLFWDAESNKHSAARMILVAHPCAAVSASCPALHVRCGRCVNSWPATQHERHAVPFCLQYVIARYAEWTGSKTYSDLVSGLGAIQYSRICPAAGFPSALALHCFARRRCCCCSRCCACLPPLVACVASSPCLTASQPASPMPTGIALPRNRPFAGAQDAGPQGGSVHEPGLAVLHVWLG